MYSRMPTRPMSRHWLFFQNSSKEHVDVVVIMVIKQLSTQTRKLMQTLPEEVQVDFRESVSSVAYGVTEQSFSKRLLEKI